MDLNLKDKSVIVTGGSSGIGLAAARLFAEEGARVVIAARRPEVLEAAARSVTDATGVRVDGVATDVRDPAALDRLVRTALDLHGRIDILVNNAGDGVYRPFLEVTDDELVHGTAVNFFAQFRLCQRVIPAMLEQGSGVIVNVTGETGIRVTTPPFWSACTGPSKAAENRLTKILASEFGERGIRVNAVVPGYVRTEERLAKWQAELGPRSTTEEVTARMREWAPGITRPGKEWGTPEELADLIVYAASDRSAFVNGAVLVADGGDDKS
ncbi:SDR family oxidoreductase [Pseudonocardia sp. NPDC049154]|uniref:SDR family NAD(P)-dependent oxidoreductase n=1 Tax=Pseudonocardia sp. NPDC049154 TaxID=3155501 RepID=UPI0033FB7733